jgi:hypothetical protein
MDRTVGRSDSDLHFLMYHEFTEDISHANDQVDVVLGVKKSGFLIGPRTGPTSWHRTLKIK